MTSKEREAYMELPIAEKYEHEDEFYNHLTTWAIRNYAVIRKMLEKAAGDFT